MTKDERVRYTFRLPVNLMKIIRNKSEEKGVTLNAFMLQILWEWVNQQHERERRWEKMEREQITISTSLRLPEERNEYIRKKADEIGLSQNGFMLMLIDLGIKLYESKIQVNPSD